MEPVWVQECAGNCRIRRSVLLPLSAQHGNTPLHFARDPGIIDMLLGAGAAVDAGNMVREGDLERMLGSRCGLLVGFSNIALRSMA